MGKDEEELVLDSPAGFVLSRQFSANVALRSSEKLATTRVKAATTFKPPRDGPEAIR